MPDYVIAIDQGTTSTRAIAFAQDGTITAVSQREHEQIFPHPGWVEHSPVEIRDNSFAVLKSVRSQLDADDTVVAIGITNQRETAIVWDRLSGEPIANAIVWQDTRTAERIEALAAEGGTERFREQTGLPLSSYFSASKVQWILEEVPGARERAERGELLFGTPDSWVLWNLTGGVDGGVHVTDVSNASRTLLYNIHTLDWDDALLSAFGIPRSMLPRVRSSSEVYGNACPATGLEGVPVAGILGDQQAAAFGQSAFDAGECKNTYGTGNFLLLNTGTEAVDSQQGLITTIAYQLGGEDVHYALEGSIAVTGSLVQWLRDNLGLIQDSADVERLARSVDDNGGAYIVPAFSGLLAPHWRPDARGVIVGLTRYIHKGHLARAALEATAFQTREVLDAIAAELDEPIRELRVDGGMIVNELLMQFQADVLGIPVIRPQIAETTALGAAYAAGLAVGFWSGLGQLRTIWQEQQRWLPQIDQQERERRLRLWRKAVARSFDWVDEDV